VEENVKHNIASKYRKILEGVLSTQATHWSCSSVSLIILLGHHFY